MGQITISDQSVAQLMPMHLRIDVDGHITGHGPTVAKLFGAAGLVGDNFFDLFEVRRPLWVTSVTDIIAANGEKLHLILRDDAQYSLKAVGMPIGDTAGVLLDISFGISVVEAIGKYDLTLADFAATDLAVEMLYLIEAKSLAMSESRNLNTRLQGAMIAAKEQAFSDALTGLKNRRAMDHVIARFIKAGEEFGLMQVDLDYFKKVNDTMGHAAGDFVLLEVAKILSDETRNDDLVARVGGDEFVLIFHKMTDIDRLNDIAGRIIKRLEVPIAFEGGHCHISASIGTTVSSFYQNPKADKMLSDADLALYSSKHKGRACYTVFSDALLEAPLSEKIFSEH